MEKESKELRFMIKFYTVMEYVAIFLPLATSIVLFIFWKDPMIFASLLPAIFVALFFGQNKQNEQKKLEVLLNEQQENE